MKQQAPKIFSVTKTSVPEQSLHNQATALQTSARLLSPGGVTETQGRKICISFQIPASARGYADNR